MKDAADAQLSDFGVRNRDSCGGVPIHLVGRIFEWRIVEVDAPTLPCRDAGQFRPINGRRMML